MMRIHVVACDWLGDAINERGGWQTVVEGRKEMLHPIPAPKAEGGEKCVRLETQLKVEKIEAQIRAFWGQLAGCFSSEGSSVCAENQRSWISVQGQIVCFKND